MTDRRALVAATPPVRRLVRLSVCLLIFLLAGCSFAEGAPPPPGSRVQAPDVTPTVVAETLPATVSADAGAVIFAARCAACHGPTGAGDGDLAGQLDNPPGNLRDLTLVRQRTPEDWFAVITNGRIERQMPPFGRSLTSDERWHLVAFLFSLSAGDESRLGAETYAANCASCHGPQGEGDSDNGPALNNPLTWVTRSAADVFAATGADTALPEHDFSAVGDDARWAAASFARSLAFPASAAAAPIEGTRGTVQVQVRNGTAGAGVAAGELVRLVALQGQVPTSNYSTTVAADGVAVFEDVLVRPGLRLVPAAEYQGSTYLGAPITVEGEDTPLVSTLTVFESSDDASVLSLDGIDTYVAVDQPGSVTVAQLFVVRNNSDRTISVPGGTVRITLPPGALNITVDGAVEGETYVRTADGVAILRTVQPGAPFEVVVTYALPVDGPLAFTQRLNYPAGGLAVLLQDQDLTLTSAGWEARGVENLQGSNFLVFTAAGVPAGGQLAFTLAGPRLQSEPVTLELLVAGIIAVAVAAIIAVWWVQRRAVPRTRPQLIAAIAHLDDDYAAGTVARVEYERRRAELKRQLLAQWGEREA